MAIDQPPHKPLDPDVIAVIRPELREQSIVLRGRDLPADQRRRLRRALRTLHTLEIMAVNIYRFQITSEPSDLNRRLIAAMCNEMTHVQDFLTALYAYGFRPSPVRWAYWLVGWAFGVTSRLRGRRAILATGVWVESKAVAHYQALLDGVNWDDALRAVIEKDRTDELGHIARWREMLERDGRA